MKTHLCLRISELCPMDSFIGQSQNKNSWLIKLILILDKEVSVNLPLEDISKHFP